MTYASRIWFNFCQEHEIESYLEEVIGDEGKQLKE